MSDPFHAAPPAQPAVLPPHAVEFFCGEVLWTDADGTCHRMPDAEYQARLRAQEAASVPLFDPADDRTVRRRLAWLSPRSGHALILNRRGLRVNGDSNLDALARSLAAGRLRLVSADVHPAELAWRATLANLERIAGGSPQEAAHGR